jgi:hypothetical protein
MRAFDRNSAFGNDPAQVPFQFSLYARWGTQRTLRVIFVRDRCAGQGEN